MKSDFFDIKFWKFILVGVLNTIFSAVVMFLLYNIASFGYWGSSVISYILGSILSFVLNRNFTFENSGSVSGTAVKFVINVAVCYFIAFCISKPLVEVLLSNIQLSVSIKEQIAMLFGMVLFTLLNYVGQRFFAFK